MSSNPMPTLTSGSTEQQIPVAYTAADAILSGEMEQMLPHDYYSGIPLRDLGEALCDSYNGNPDMIAVVLGWSSARSLDSNALLQAALENVLKSHKTEIVTKLDTLLLTSAQRLSVVSSIMKTPYWRHVFASLASSFPNSPLLYQLNRERRLAAIGVSYDIYESPQSVWCTIRETIEEVFCNPNGDQITNERLDEMYKKIAIIATEDEIFCLLSLRLLHTLSIEAKSKVIRSVSHAASTHVCAAFSETLSQKSGLGKIEAKHYATRLRLTVAIKEGETMLSENTLKSIFTLTTPVDTTGSLQAERRRIDKAIGTVHSLYNRLLNQNDILSHANDVNVIGVDDDIVIETVSENLSSLFVRFSLMRLVSYPEMREDLVRTVFTKWCDVGTTSTAPAAGITSRGENTDSRRRKCVCLMLAHAEVAAMLSDEQLRDMLSNSDGIVTLRKRVTHAERTFKESASACMAARTEIERGNLKRQNLEVLITNASDMTVAWGVIMWADEALTGGQGETQGSVASDAKGVSSNASRHVALLEMVIREHAELTKVAVDVLQRAALRSPRKGEPESALRSQRHALLRTLATWVKLDGGVVILESFHKDWAPTKKMSNEDLRTFVSNLLQVVAPPFLPAFSTALMALLRHDRVVQAVAEDNALSSRVLTVQSSAYGV